MRATNRVVSADQCGVPLERRFAFYDQIHTTGMDTKHVVNATAVLTLGKDMVFRDYVQGSLYDSEWMFCGGLQKEAAENQSDEPIFDDYESGVRTH